MNVLNNKTMITVKTRKGLKNVPYRINVFGTNALLYEEFLKRAGYSPSSSYRYARINKYPNHFYKNQYGKYYINEHLANELKKPINERVSPKNIKGLPKAIQTELFKK